jgi:hypothetical protein
MLKDSLPPHLGVDPLLTEHEVAVWLRMSLRTLTRKRQAGLIKGIPWNARRWRYRKSEIERFIAAAEQGGHVYFGDKAPAPGGKGVSPSAGNITAKAPGAKGPRAKP